MKTITTHTNPDLDAITSAWLIKRYLPGWREAKVEFVTADQQAPNQGVADDNLWVDVGLGQLDHHQTGEYLSAARLTLEYIKKQRQGEPLKPLDEKALEVLVGVVTEIDNARDLAWPEANHYRYYFNLASLVDGYRGRGAADEKVLKYGFQGLDALLWNLRNRLRAEEELDSQETTELATPWGKGVALTSANRFVLWVAEVRGYAVALLKDPENGSVRIHARPDSKVDLTKAYEAVKKADPQADWFLHASKKMLLNQSSVNIGMKPTKLGIADIIKILKS